MTTQSKSKTPLQTENTTENSLEITKRNKKKAPEKKQKNIDELRLM